LNYLTVQGFFLHIKWPINVNKHQWLITIKVLNGSYTLPILDTLQKMKNIFAGERGYFH